ncbi:Bile acid:sodium symporter family protein OS=Streptomyces microflavus OX=1919 GN=G3I39_41065 PE=4 SV=1 [Streptomyces microflavus]
MNDSALITTGLPIALAIIMFGLGLSLTTDDFRRVTRSPKAVVVALVLQVLVLPLVAFGLVKIFDLDPLLAVGVMLLAASPGGTTANLFSHLFRGDVALNITLTAINSVLAAIAVPIIADLASGRPFRRRGRPRSATRQGGAGDRHRAHPGRRRYGGPSALGRLRRTRRPSGPDLLHRRLVIVSVGALLGERENWPTTCSRSGW